MTETELTVTEAAIYAAIPLLQNATTLNREGNRQLADRDIRHAAAILLRVIGGETETVTTDLSLPTQTLSVDEARPMSDKEELLDNLFDLFEIVEGCCLHNPIFTAKDVDRIITWSGDRKSGPESDTIVVVHLKDGLYGLFTQSEDFTGHGCQCSSMTIKHYSLSNLIGGLDDWSVLKLLTKGQT